MPEGERGLEDRAEGNDVETLTFEKTREGFRVTNLAPLTEQVLQRGRSEEATLRLP